MDPSWESTKKSSQGEDLRRKSSCCNYKGGDTCINCLRGSFMDGYKKTKLGTRHHFWAKECKWHRIIPHSNHTIFSMS